MDSESRYKETGCQPTFARKKHVVESPTYIAFRGTWFEAIDRTPCLMPSVISHFYHVD